jgi:hypothetical protein
MKKIIVKSFVVLTFGLMASCTASGPLIITDNANSGSKVGESSFTSYLGFPPFNGDNSIETAAKNGGIKKISTVDTKITGGLFSTKYSTIVTGE